MRLNIPLCVLNSKPTAYSLSLIKYNKLKINKIIC